MTRDSKIEKVSVLVGWVFAIFLVGGYFYAISPKASARYILRELQYESVKKAHLLALSSHESDRVHVEDALIVVEFTTNTWRLLHAGRSHKGVLPEFNWKHRLVHDTHRVGFQDYHQRPTESEVEAFLVREGWFFESSADNRFLEGEVFSNVWERALGYQPTHTWTAPTKVYSPDSLRIIDIMNALCLSTNAEAQESLMEEYAAIGKPAASRRERTPRPRFLAFTEGKEMVRWNPEKRLEVIKWVAIWDDSGTPPLFESSLIEIRSPKVLKIMNDLETRPWNTDASLTW